MARKEILVGIGVDVDAVAGQIGSYAGGDSPSDISRGVFAAEVGTPRMLTLFDRLGIQTSWFIPGHSIETFPKEMKAVAAAGHEIGLHGYTHENPIAMTPEQEADILDKTIDLVSKLQGRRPTGYVAPWWEMSAHTPHLLMERGIKYDHKPDASRLRAVLDADQRGMDADRLFQAGEDLDEADEEGQHLPHRANPRELVSRRSAADDVHEEGPELRGWTNPRDIEDWWRDQFDWVYRELDYAVYTLTIHPDISGRPQTLLMLERIIAHINAHDGVRWATFDQIADDFIKRRPFKGKKPSRKK